MNLSISYFDRFDYVSTISQEGLIVNILERYLHGFISDYLSSIRLLFYELSRIGNHLLAITTHGIDIGSLNSMLLAFEEREKINNVHEYLSGSRIHSSLLFSFSIRYDIPLRFIIFLIDFIIDFPFLNKEIHSILSSSPIFIIRLFNVGIIDHLTCIRGSISGINIRSTGIGFDGRLFYLCRYYHSSFSTFIGHFGDSLCRYYNRMNELMNGLSIISDVISSIPFSIDSSLSLVSSSLSDSSLSLHHHQAIIGHHHSFNNSSTSNITTNHMLSQGHYDPSSPDHSSSFLHLSSASSYHPSFHHLSVNNIHKSMSHFFIHHRHILSSYSLHFSLRLFMECPKGIQSAFIYYGKDLLSHRGYHYRDSRIDVINNDFITIFNIHKYIQSLYIPDFIALIGSIDFVLGFIDCLHYWILLEFHLSYWII